MPKLFNVAENNITYHLQNIFKTGELEQDAVTQKIRVTASDGKKYNTKFYRQVKLGKIISMQEWKEKLEVFLKINEYNILKDNGKIKREIADKLALDEYKKYRVIQDKNYISDFDELVTETKNLNNI